MIFKKIILGFIFFPIIIDANTVNFVIVIPSYNNEKWCVKNLDSVFSQDYPHFRVIYINDASKDKTGELVKKYIKDHQLESRCTYWENEVNRGALYNLYHAIHSCDDTEVIVTVDGDDWLDHSEVLTRVSHEYQNHDVWLTYGQYTHNGGKYGVKGCGAPIASENIKNNTFRKHMWCTSHLRTFYAKLFKLIEKEDLVYEGEFFRVAWDVAMMMPMLEMAQERHRFIPEFLYVYNIENVLNDFKLHEKKQFQYANYILDHMTPYFRIEHLHGEGLEVFHD